MDTRKPEQRYSNLLSLILRSLSASFLSQAKRRTLLPVSSPSNYSSINDIHHYPSRQFDPLSAIDRRLLPETWQHLDLKVTHNDNGALGSTFAFFQTKWTRFPFKHLPFIYCNTGKCRLLPPSILVTFGSTFSRTGFVLLYPLSPTSLLTATTCAFSHCSPKLKSYLRIIHHALDSLYDTCSDFFFFISTSLILP